MPAFEPNINLLDLITGWDIAVFFLVLLATVAAIFYGQHIKRRQQIASFIDHLVMGRTLTLPMFIGTLVATWYGGIFGVTEIAFNHGIYNFITQGVFWYVTYIIFALFLVHRIARFKALTLPELVGQMFGPRAQKVSAVFNFLNVVPVAYCLSMGLFLQITFGFDLLTGVVIGTVFVCFYAAYGGFRADVYSDMVQFYVMCTSVFLVVVFSISQFGGFGFLTAKLPPTHFDPRGGHSLATTMVWGLIALSTLVDPNFYQRCFAVQDHKIARKGILLSTIVWLCFDICTTLGGMYARAVIPQAEPGQSYMIYALQLFPPGLRGFFIAGVLATIVSTVDSYICVASQTLSYDLGPERYKRSNVARTLSIVFVGVLAASLALLFDGSIKDVWKTLGSYSAGCMLLPILIGYLRPGLIKDQSFVLGSVLGAIGITYWRFASHEGFWAEVDDLYIGVFCTMLGLAFGQVVFNRVGSPAVATVPKKD